MKTFKNMNVKTKQLKKTQTEVKLEMRNLEGKIKISEVRFINKLYGMEERICTIEDKLGEMDSSVKKRQV